MTKKWRESKKRSIRESCVIFRRGILENPFGIVKVKCNDAGSIRFALSPSSRRRLATTTDTRLRFRSSLSFVFGILIEWAYVSYRERSSRHKCFSRCSVNSRKRYAASRQFTAAGYIIQNREIKSAIHYFLLIAH